MTNLAMNLAATARRYPDRPAIRLDDTVLTYAELAEQSARVTGLLTARGVAPGDRVALMLPNVLAFPALYYGILRAGAVVVPMNPLLKAREVEHYLSDSGAALLFVAPASTEEAKAGAGQVPLIEVDEAWPGFVAGQQPNDDVVDREDGDTAVILYTSGTTGKPKGAQLSHSNLVRNTEVTARTLLCLAPDDVVMGCLPLFHSFGQVVGLNTSVYSGACLTLIARFDPVKAMDVIARDRVTVFEGVPTMYAALLHHGGQGDVSSLRLCVSGGAPLPVEILHAFEEAFGAIILEGYGLSETSPVASFNHPDRPRKPGSIGLPIEGVLMRVVNPEGEDVPVGEVGEIAIQGHNVMTGYWHNPEATAQAIPDGWFRTGDLGRIDEDGYFFIVDRKKDMIIRGGFNVYPREVEDVLYEHPAVAEAAVIGRPHPELGEEVAAAVALKPGATAEPAELIEFVRQRLAAYKYPREVWIVDALPKTATGKILRREVRPAAPSGSVAAAPVATSTDDPAVATAADDPVVATAAGRVRGTVQDGVLRFLGIPYAAAPFGEHRFQAPAPVPAWEGVRDARVFGPTAPKGPFNPPLDRLLPEPVIDGDECLNLNIWTPVLGDEQRRPVMVWIHGGSLKNGSNAADIYDGRSFARNGAVLVSLNYRLGVEGFAVFPDAPSNRGLLDQIAALRWIRDNIAAFGGDPDNVTVFGQSAGAICIAALMVSPRAEGLFRQAIMQSGPPLAVSPKDGARISEVMAKALRVPATAKAFAAVDRGKLLAAQIAATSKGNPLFGGAGFQVVVDGDVVPRNPATALSQGVARDINLVVGFTRDEYRLWFVPNGLVDRMSAVTLRLALLKFRIPARIRRGYRSRYRREKPGEILGRIAGDMLIRGPVYRLADRRAGQSKTFVYEFAWPTTVEQLGACHALEIGFVFNTLAEPGSLALTGPNPPQGLADAMQGAWVEFARTGAPGWEPWNASRPLMRFDMPSATAAHTPQDDEIKLWL